MGFLNCVYNPIVREIGGSVRVFKGGTCGGVFYPKGGPFVIMGVVYGIGVNQSSA